MLLLLQVLLQLLVLSLLQGLLQLQLGQEAKEEAKENLHLTLQEKEALQVKVLLRLLRRSQDQPHLLQSQTSLESLGSSF